MAHKREYFRTENKDDFIREVVNAHPEAKRSTVERHFFRNKLKYGTQKSLRKIYSRKYDYEFSYTDNQEEFIEECKHHYPQYTRDNFRRRYYDVKKRFGVGVSVSKDVIKKQQLEYIGPGAEPSQLKLMIIDDMKRFGYKMSAELLMKHGFSRAEIEWLEAHDKI